MGCQTSQNISQAIPVCELPEGHAIELATASEVFYFIVTVILSYTLIERISGKEIH
jgi:hypothetical protein